MVASPQQAPPIPPAAADTDNDHNHQASPPPFPRQVSTWPETWRQFNVSLRNPREDFNPFVWIIRLVRAGCDHVYVSSGCARCVVRFQLDKAWRPVIPYCGLGLVVLVLVAYYLSIRHVIRTRWCCENATTTTTTDVGASAMTCASPSCLWMHVHDGVVAYFGFMIMFHYLCTVFRTPGVVLPLEKINIKTNPPLLKWKAMESQGGLLGIDPICHVEKERALVALYGSLDVAPPPEQQAHVGAAAPLSSTGGSSSASAKPTAMPSSSSSPTCPRNFPSTHATFCEKCQVMRPPRCHHCSICQRCILQFDHHCVWVNQCIGYNNYRHFVLMLFFFMIGCWYGVALLFHAFYEPFREQIRQHGLKWMYSNGTGVLDLPMPGTILMHLVRGDMPSKMVIDMVYPLLLGIGAVLSWFLGFHVKYILKARTTLEHSIRLEDEIAQVQAPTGRGQNHQQYTNPFDQGYRGNMRQILGPSIVACFLPVIVNPPRPFIPSQDKSK